MNTIQMEYFLATAEYGSFSRTAAFFYTTQPTVSRQISLMEEELGYELFDRSSKPLTLTAAGRIIYDGLKPLIGSMKSLIKLGELAAKGQYGRLVVSFPIGLQVENCFSEILHTLKATLTNLNITYQKEDVRIQKESLLSRKTDVALCFHTPAIEDGELRFIDIGPTTSYFLTSREHPLASKEFLMENDLLGETILLPEPLSGYSYSHGQLGGFWIDKDKLVGVDSIPSALINVRFNNGITLANNYMDIMNHDYYKAFPFLDNSRNPKMSIITRKNGNNPAIPFFCEIIRDSFRKSETFSASYDTIKVKGNHVFPSDV